jgi:hypothetical protein
MHQHQAEALGAAVACAWRPVLHAYDIVLHASGFLCAHENPASITSTHSLHQATLHGFKARGYSILFGDVCLKDELQ